MSLYHRCITKQISTDIYVENHGRKDHHEVDQDTWNLFLDFSIKGTPGLARKEKKTMIQRKTQGEYVT